MYTIIYIKILVLIGTGLALMNRKLHKPSRINIYVCVCVYTVYIYMRIYIFTHSLLCSVCDTADLNKLLFFHRYTCCIKEKAPVR